MATMATWESIPSSVIFNIGIVIKFIKLILTFYMCSGGDRLAHYWRVFNTMLKKWRVRNITRLRRWRRICWSWKFLFLCISIYLPLPHKCRSDSCTSDTHLTERKNLLILLWQRKKMVRYNWNVYDEIKKLEVWLKFCFLLGKILKFLSLIRSSRIS